MLEKHFYYSAKKGKQIRVEMNNRYYSAHACSVLHSAILTPTALIQGTRTQESVKTVTTNNQETKKYYTSLLWSALLYTPHTCQIAERRPTNGCLQFHLVCTTENQESFGEYKYFPLTIHLLRKRNNSQTDIQRKRTKNHLTGIVHSYAMIILFFFFFT